MSMPSFSSFCHLICPLAASPHLVLNLKPNCKEKSSELLGFNCVVVNKETLEDKKRFIRYGSRYSTAHMPPQSFTFSSLLKFI